MTRFLILIAVLIGLNLPAYADDNIITLQINAPETNQAMQGFFTKACPGAIKDGANLGYYPRQVHLRLQDDKLMATDGKSTLIANALSSTEEQAKAFNTQLDGKLFWLNVIPWGKNLARVALFNQSEKPGAPCIRVVPSFFALLTFLPEPSE